MRLSTIKLAGFKSFVDPTTLHLRSNMTGVVGPNGCGKSNIIDAVRWVMGESSASRLRGDALTDVIFSGSSARKPVSQAVVELVFDNSDHTISGEYAAFNEVSVKRTVSRDGQSNYYLNGAKCRRRDITDLFLGTGLGPRSYSIIEQGMISQVIEAKPEELRVYLEEAAGISKYKERRKETEQRIRHTRENLDRLNDLREEVGKQLAHLARQAKQAEIYTALAEQRKVKDAQLKALEFAALDTQLGQQRQALAQAETALEKTIAEQRHAERALEAGRSERDAAADALAKAQAQVYEISAAVARIEQQISHQRELGQRLLRARDEAQTQLAELGEHISGDAEQLEILQMAIAEAEPALEMLKQEDAVQQESLRDAEEALTQWQQQWDTHSRTQSDAAQRAEVERTRVDYLDKQALDGERRLQALDEELASFDLDSLQAGYEDLQLRQQTHGQTLEELNQTLDTRKQRVLALQEQARTIQTQLSALRQQTQEARGRLVSLETLQHAALGQDAGAAMQWLRQRGLDKAVRVGEALHVQAGWETAVEVALGQLIEAVLVDDPQTWVDALAELQEGSLSLVSHRTTQTDAQPDFAPSTLAAKVQGPMALRQLLAQYHGAETLTDANALLETLANTPYAGIITRAGERIGSGWVQVSRTQTAQQGALLREKQIQQLRADIDTLQQQEQAQDAALAQTRDAALAADQAREETQRSLYQIHRSISELAGQLQSVQGRLQSAQLRIDKIHQEKSHLNQTMQSASDATRQARSQLQEAIESMASLEQQRQELDSQRRGLVEVREHIRQQARQTREHAHAMALKLESQRTQAQALSQSLQRMDGQRGQLDARLQTLLAQLADGDSPVLLLQDAHQAELEKRLQAEQTLAQARSTLENVDATLRQHESTRQQRDAQALQQREALAQYKLDQQALLIHAEQIRANLQDTGFALDTVLDAMPAQANINDWQRDVAELDGKIKRLEPVNLAAIAEHAEAAQRKDYLDAQDADLTAALETLEEAIKKIDRETRGRFKDTFDRVNAGVQALYPRLFGGGHAYLELTGEDLLTTGVTIMARPPGKRVSSISLLSGGEKAMTAVALVFAIFQLNPAPFCLLDEVDAPLDEANVGRLASMVKEMSQAVQFLFVTHNKATMEAAEQLSGVTMREPGVSRLVSVDLAEASRLVGQ